MSESLKEYIYNRIDHHEKHHEYEVATETIRCWIDAYQEQEEPEDSTTKELGLAFALILFAAFLILIGGWAIDHIALFLTSKF